ncbi:MAG TPA: hypothetical protein VHP83_21810, partial [Aggregatilineaceae bacterium]|nr:hypothetical protein [Aggregatilineaceae bacterium]
MQQIIAELTVRDMATSIAWYKALGFSVEMEGIQDEQGFQWVSMGREGRSVWLLRQDISRHDGDGTPITSQVTYSRSSGPCRSYSSSAASR